MNHDPSGQKYIKTMKPFLQDIFQKARDCIYLNKAEALQLMEIRLHTDECFALMAVADQLSRRQFGAKGENHFHIGLNSEACPLDCLFCSLSHKAGIFRGKVEFSIDQVIAWARQAEAAGADALNLMTTGTYPFQKLLDIGQLLSHEVSLPLVANTRDINHSEGEELLEAGFVAAYHAVRLGEGRVTPLKREKRIETLQVLRDIGLSWANCVEPVGPEHEAEELVELMFLARDYGASYSGVMRRINFPGSPMEPYGMISELEMARLVAISRLIMADVPDAHCTHEPHAASLMAGANLFFPEVGSSPRDGLADTGKGRGKGIEFCQQIQREMDLDPLLPSNCYQQSKLLSSHD